MSANDVIETYIKLHQGKIGQHWLWAAIERIVAGDDEAEVMRDFGFVRASLLNSAEADLASMIKSYQEVRAMYFEVRAMLEATMEQTEGLQEDVKRMDFLESLCHRTDPNMKPGINDIGSDMHFRRGNSTLYIRNCTGHVVNSGFGTVREAVDAARAKLGDGDTAHDGHNAIGQGSAGLCGATTTKKGN